MRTKNASMSFVVLLLVGLTMGASGQDHSYKPKEGFVPDAKTAIQVAEAVLIPIYGEAQIVSERPFKAELTGKTWHVEGSLPVGASGGVAEVWISKNDCKVLRVTHGK